MKGVAHCGQVVIAELIVCLTIVIIGLCIETFLDSYTAGLRQVMVWTCYVSV